MSRIGKQPVAIPNNLEVKVEGDIVFFKKDNIQEKLDTRGNVIVKIENSQIIFSPKSDDRADRAFWGTYRSLCNNIVVGLMVGFQKKLEINGVGYKAAVNGSSLDLQLGFSHPIKFEIPSGVTIVVEKNIVSISGNNKQQIGQIAAEIRAFRPPEPYKGKGVKYVDEKIIRKAGKTSKK